MNLVLDEILGLGPLEPLLRDQTIREIRIASPDDVQVVRDGTAEPAVSAFAGEGHLQKLFARIFRAVDHKLVPGENQATMKDGSTLSATLADGRLSVTITRP